MIDPAFQIDSHIERFVAQRLEMGLFQTEMLPNSDPPTVNRRTTRNHPGVVCHIGGGDMLRVRRLARSRFGYEENGRARRVGTARRRLAASA